MVRNTGYGVLVW